MTRKPVFKLVTVTVIFAMLVVSVRQAIGEDAGERQPEKYVLTPEVRKELLKKAERWSLPKPDRRAKLVKVMNTYYLEPVFDGFGFSVPGQSEKVLVGFEYQGLDKTQVIRPVAKSESRLLKQLKFPIPSKIGVYGVNNDLLFGIQLLSHGEEKFGVALINRGLQEDHGHWLYDFYSPAGERPTLMLARACLASAMNDLLLPKPDYRDIKRRIERLLADEPKLKNEGTAQTLMSLAASIAHRPDTTNEIETLVENYLRARVVHGITRTVHTKEFSKAQRALILRGFKAVPALMRHRRSVRFTRHWTWGIYRYPSHVMDAAGAISEYLAAFSNTDFGETWIVRNPDTIPYEKDVRAWWKRASAMGEKAYVKQHIIARDPWGKTRVSFELLLLASQKYPSLLPPVYRKLLKTKFDTNQVAATIAESKLSRAEKIALLQAGIATNRLQHRYYAMEHLVRIDRKVADERLLQLVRKAPRKARTKETAHHDASMAQFVSQSRDPEVWKAMHAWIDRAELGMQMQLVNYLEPPRDTPRAVLRSFHRIYDRFRNDKRVFDAKTGNPYSGCLSLRGHDCIAMRDFIHLHWSWWLRLKLKPPKPKATAEQWKAYRERVARDVDKQRAK